MIFPQFYFLRNTKGTENVFFLNPQKCFAIFMVIYLENYVNKALLFYIIYKLKVLASKYTLFQINVTLQY